MGFGNGNVCGCGKIMSAKIAATLVLYMLPKKKEKMRLIKLHHHNFFFVFARAQTEMVK